MSLAATVPVTAFAILPWIDRGLSEDARVVRNLVISVSEFPESIALGEPKRVVQQALDRAYLAAKEDDWDGMGSARVEPSTYQYASQFLRMLPASLPRPDVSVDTDGEILCEWDFGPRHVFSVSVGRDGTLTFAGLNGHTKIHGTDHLREVLPLVIAHSLQRLVGQATS